MRIQLTKESSSSYKIGADEIVGLNEAMTEVMRPIQNYLKELVYWNDCELESSEYKIRDGFIPHSHNCGGIELTVIIPKCEEYEFGFLEFGECDECGDDGKQCGFNGRECSYESDGHLDAKLRVWLKFEGIDGDELKFWLYLGGGNGDAPYFRTSFESDLFEASFTCKSVSGLKRAASKHVSSLIKVMKGA